MWLAGSDPTLSIPTVLLTADPTGGLGWISTGGLVTMTLFMLWAFLKSPPLFVPYREHLAVLSRNEKLEAENERLAETGAHALDTTEELQRLLRDTLTALTKDRGVPS